MNYENETKLKELASKVNAKMSQFPLLNETTNLVPA
jgi:hypothetical protein